MNVKHGTKVASIFANAVSNIVDDIGKCGTKHFFQNGQVSLKPDSDEISFNNLKAVARYIPHEQIDDFLFNILDEMKKDGGCFGNINLDEIVPDWEKMLEEQKLKRVNKIYSSKA